VLGKASFDVTKLIENFMAFYQAIIKAKPSGAKGQYLKRIAISSTMSPGYEIDLRAARAAGEKAS
jgi:large subunit ribosomal protein L1